MTSKGGKKCLSWKRVNHAVLILLLCCLIAVCHSVDSRSTSELLSDIEMEDNSQFLPQQLGSSDDTADEYVEMDELSDETLLSPDKREDSGQARQKRRSSSSNRHPVYLGYGQETADAALQAYYGLTMSEEELRRAAASIPNTVLFVGK